jgi:predicted alpha-1,6-mannanase (GH76 family)
MSDRELVLEAIQEMPETVSLREIVDELQIMAVTSERMDKNPQGKGVSAEELLRQVSSWVIK